MSTTALRLTHDWLALLAQYPDSLRQQIALIANEYRQSLAEEFYRHMLADEQAGPLLVHQKVKQRLEPSLQRWVSSLLAAKTLEEVNAQLEAQKTIGEVHARIDIPMALVLRGSRQLKQRLNQYLQQSIVSAELADAIGYSNACIDIAMELMSDAYSQSHNRSERAQEAYRLFSVTQNVSSDRQRQRAALLDWENQLMFEVASGNLGQHLPPVCKSEFGLWFRHKAQDSFQGAPQIEQIETLLDEIDQHCLPAFTQAATSLELLRKVRDLSKSVQYLLDNLFEQVSDLESGRDALTQLLNRKFLPVVLGKQVATARRNNTQFALLMVDIDHFKRINDQHGHEIGDQVLQHTASVLTSSMRAGDYAFRHGGEEFLLLIVDTHQANAHTFAERIRQDIELNPLQLSSGINLNVTISIGIAMHDGHPDFLRSLRRADQALYQAKQNGRNCCVLDSTRLASN